ncbi:hypothetical protein EVJ58_g6733 [Rhodofomes roseus]|uniref:Uncharacterized protein n=1 Tax=Rhodofomes roseus TaxID=34475 RepID=A0A4Y9Y7P4_9APHY|nr:hypothetical protein EVJ58_g6733 [Rhodofomes roseus]
MPPKRKAPSAADDEQPTTKRVTRSRKPSAEQVVLPTVKPRKPRRGAANSDISPDVVKPPQDAPIATRTRRTVSRSEPAEDAAPDPRPRPSRPRTKAQKKPAATKRRGKRAVVEDEDDEKSDEVPLSLPQKPFARPATPPRPSNSRPSTSRVFMECVEIRTSARSLTNGMSAVRYLNAGAPASGPPRSSTPSPSKRIGPPTSPAKSRPNGPVRASPAAEDIGALAGPSSVPISPPATPSKGTSQTRTPIASPSKRRGVASVQSSPTRQAKNLPPHLYACLHAQQREILQSLRDVPDIEDEPVEAEDEEPPTNAVAFEELSNLLRGTVLRGEGNSCLLIGARGSGKTRIVEKAIAALPERPIIIRLSGHAQQNDRQAIREIARQLTQQTGTSFLPTDDEKTAEDGLNDPENPFLESRDVADAVSVIALPAPAHLLALISMIPTLPRATVIVLDAFDQFASHARQSLLYCLLDTVQNCRVGKANKGLAVVGVTARVDTINLLEKRVKSRFSGRMLRTACPRRLRDWTNLARTILTAPRAQDDDNDEWEPLWAASVESFLGHPGVKECFKDTFGLTRDVYTLRRLLVPVVIELSETTPFLSPATFTAAAGTQRCPARFPFLSGKHLC